MNGKLIVSEGGRDRIHEICEDRVLIGNGPTVDLHLKDPSVSGKHCEIRTERNGFRLMDLETAVGTKVNGNFVNSYFLQNGDTIELGGARLTYLGDSAGPRAEPRQPVQKLTVHPRDEEGQPRRFYRHETQSSSVTSWITIAFIFGALGLAALMLLWAGSAEYGPEGAKAFADAKELIKDGRKSNLEKAVRIIEELPDGAVNNVDKRTWLDTARSKLVEFEAVEKQQRENERYDTIKRGFQDGQTIQWLRGQISVYATDYPGTPRTAELKRLLTRAELGGADREKAWGEVMKAMRNAHRAKDYKSAFAHLGTAEADNAFRRLYGDQLKVHRATLEASFRRHFTKMKASAIAARESGDSAAASRIYAELAAVGLEPYATEAKTALEALN